MFATGKQPQYYAMLSNAGMLAAATEVLEQDVAAGKVADADIKLSHIDNLIRLPRAIADMPFIKMGLYHQPRLINALIKCLDPSIRFEVRNPSHDKLSLHFTALKALTEIDNLRDDTGYSSYPCTGSVAAVLSKFLCSPAMGQKLLEGYHTILTRWPNFMRDHADAYREALHDLSIISMTRDDIMTYNWIRHVAVHEINRVSPEKPNLLRSGGAKPSAAAG